MKRIFISFLLFSSFLFGESNEMINYMKIIEKIAVDILGYDRVKIKLFYQDSDIENYKFFTKIQVVSKIEDSDVVLLKNDSKNIDILKGKLVLATNYETIKTNPNVVGGVFWLKGRPNIVFLEDRIEQRGIVLPKEYEKYIEKLIY